MDGKSGAEDLIAKALKDPTLLQALAAAPKPADAAERGQTQVEEK
jgi:type VI secretion system protein ImpB